MAIPYRNNQFVSDWLRPQTDEWQNAPFQYPRRTVRHTNIDQFGLNVRTTTQLDRGFIRNLLTETVSTAGVTIQQQRQRFNFQFNPSAIEQSVQMRQDIYLPILQQPEQFAQPMSAVASFNFDILLDRTMEVGSNTVTIDGETQSVARYDVDLFGETNPATDVYQLGVLSDLQVLYSIIGQGFSNKFIESQLEQLKIQAKQEAIDNPDLGTTEADIESITKETFNGAANFGNNAFLIPLPVRVVFSELFMIDGFVTSTTVRFTKFNTSMVPIQASIGIGMNALYIGFAKQRTFLTVQLENAKNNKLAEISQTTEDNNEILTALRDSAKRFVFACDDDRDWQGGIAIGTSGTPIIRYANQQYDTDYPDVEFKLGFKDAYAQKDDDKVLQLFKSGKTLSISRSWSLSIYGPYDNALVARNDQASKKISDGVKRVGYYIGDRTDSSEDAWKEGRSRSVRSDHPSTNNLSTDKLPYNSADSNKYFVINFKITISANGVTQELDDWRTLQGTAVYRLDTPINWPAPTGTSSSSGVTGNSFADDSNRISDSRPVGSTIVRS